MTEDKMNVSENKLPDDPSALIRVALDDLKKCEADPAYEIDMGDWHNPSDQYTVCLVCLAGAVMAQRLGTDPEDYSIPCVFKVKDAAKLRALNEFRGGYVTAGLYFMSLKLPAGIEQTIPIPQYKAGPAAFHYAMNTLADTLEAAGL